MNETSALVSLSTDDFAKFYREIHGYPPYAWQTELLKRVIDRGWPAVVDMPTGSGKTALIEIAVFALALQVDLPPSRRQAAVRTFFVVDRRIVVDEADRRARQLARQLASPTEDQPVTGRVADRLKHLSSMGGIDDPSTPPLETHTLRGGFHRTPAWTQSMTQPMIITSTVDQVGSRMLFRGYGISAGSRPIQAALTGIDSLVLLDEAHISRPFAQTIKTIAEYQTVADQNPHSQTESSGESSAGLIRPVQCVQMTATPAGINDAEQVFSFDQGRDLADADSPMARRFATQKWVRLSVALGVKGKTANAKLAKDLHKRVTRLLSDPDKNELPESDVPESELPESETLTRPLAIAVVVNRVQTAKSLYELIRKDKKIDADLDLMIGSMRPVDRDQLAMRLRTQLSTGNRNQALPRPRIVVATQCLEVGADFDFDHMICEAASIDALRQRFGRLNRGGRPACCGGEVVIAQGQHLDAKAREKLKTPQDADPIYGVSMTNTFDWLLSISQGDEENSVVDFGLQAMDAHWRELPHRDGRTPGGQRWVRQDLLVDAPEMVTLLPAHVDLLAQTYRHRAGADEGASVMTVHPDPDIAVFLHGRMPRRFEVSVCWRADLCTARRRLQHPGGNVEINPSDRPVVLMSPLVRPRTQRLSAEQIKQGVPLDQPLGGEKLALAEREMVDTVSQTPPTSAECLSVSAGSIRDFLRGQTDPSGSEADVAALATTDDTDAVIDAARRPVVWRGRDDSFVLRNVNQLRPGDTLVFPVCAGGWSMMGHIPDTTSGEYAGCSLDPAADHHDLNDPATVNWLSTIDVADQAALAATWKPRLRLIPWRDGTEPIKNILDAFDERAALFNETVNSTLRQDDLFSTGGLQRRLATILSSASKQIIPLQHQTNGWPASLVITDRTRLAAETVLNLLDGSSDARGGTTPLGLELADIDFEQSEMAGTVTRLADHLGSVAKRSQSLARYLGLPAAQVDAIAVAGALHDIGKADPRFQALLHGCGLSEVHLRPTLIAKSRKPIDSPVQYERSRTMAGLPSQWRHEEMSLRLIQQSVTDPDDLTLHCVATHHAQGRPFFPPVLDASASAFTTQGLSFPWSLPQCDAQADQQAQVRTQHLQRYWRMHRQFGAWGLAYRETIVRLADWWASSRDDKQEFPLKVAQDAAHGPAAHGPAANRPAADRPAAQPVVLTGMDGSNPMAFLAATGLVQLQSQLGKPVQLSWRVHGGAWRPALHADWLRSEDDLRLLFDDWPRCELPRPLRDFDERFDGQEFEKGAGKLISIPAEFFKRTQRYASDFVSGSLSRLSIDYASGFGSEAVRKRLGGKELDQIDHSQLYMTKGSGHQRMLELMRTIHAGVEPDHYEKTLFQPWVYDDPGRGMMLRWDPADESQYALAWGNPSNNPGMTVLGANDLAIHAIAMFPTAAVDQRLQTTCFARLGRRATYFTWPLWTRPLDRESMIALMQWGYPHRDVIDSQVLASQGVAATMRCERKRNDKFFNFSVATAVG